MASAEAPEDLTETELLLTIPASEIPPEMPGAESISEAITVYEYS